MVDDSKNNNTDVVKDYYFTLQQIGHLKKEGKIHLDDIPLYTNLKIDLNKKIEILNNIITQFIPKDKKYANGLHATLSYFLKRSKSSYLALAYHLNNYMESLRYITYFWLTEKMIGKWKC